MNNDQQSPQRPGQPPRSGVKSSKHPPKTHRERARHNAAMGYPPAAALRRSGAKRKPIRNMRHWAQGIELGKARRSGDAKLIAKQELVLARTIIPAEHFDAEPELSELAFVPYRLKSGYQRTQDFAAIFDELFREYRKRHWAKDTRLAPRTQLHAWPDADIVALWQARQHADLLGLPYRYYIRQAFEHCMAAGYKRCPAPNQIWREPVRKAIEEASKHGAGRIAYTEYRADVLHPMFLAENYRGHPIQVAAHDDLAAKVKQFPDFFKPGWILLHDQIMPEAEARKRLGDARVDSALAGYASYKPSTQREPLPMDAEILPGCYGTYRAKSDVCRVCTVASSCRVIDRDVRDTLIVRHGTDAPRAAKETSDATERKRRQRERERLDRAAGRTYGTEEGKKPR